MQPRGQCFRAAERLEAWPLCAPYGCAASVRRLAEDPAEFERRLALFDRVFIPGNEEEKAFVRALLPDQIAKAMVPSHLLAAALDGGSLGDNAGHRLAFDRMGQRTTRSVTGRILLHAMAGRFATLAEAPDQRPRTHIANFGQPRLQLVTLDLQNFESRRMGHGVHL